VLGETHQCSAKLGSGKNAPEVTFVGEQVLHHPPVTAFAIHHPAARVSIEGNVSFGVKFHGNSVSCDTKGFSLLNWDNKEHYRITKGLPDVMISNVIIGSRAMSWSGTVEITCEETGYTAKLLFKRKKQNCVVGEIFYKNYRSGDQPLYVFEGCWSEEPITAQPAEDGMAPILVFDNSEAKKLDIDYFPSEKLPETDSLKVWYDVSRAIAEDDLARADEAKTAVEGAQRKRVKEGAEDLANPRKFFEADSEGIWRWNGGMYHDKVVRVLDNEDVSESVDDTTGSEHHVRKSSSGKKSTGGNKKAQGKHGKKLNRQLSATNTSASMSTSTDFSAVSETDFE
jgi:oxysterol-binding protein-related protein 8